MASHRRGPRRPTCSGVRSPAPRLCSTEGARGDDRQTDRITNRHTDYRHMRPLYDDYITLHIAK